MLSFRPKYKTYDFEAGSLYEDEIPLASESLDVSRQFVAPRKLDFRDMCLTSSDQLQNPHCAGYSTAGYIEVQNWKNKHYPEQVDGDAIYFEAKRIDGYSGGGTKLGYAVQAAINLNLIKGTPKYVSPSRNDVKFAIHQYGVCIGGFKITNEWNKIENDTNYISILNDIRILGGHAVLICGYDDIGVYIQNSWGDKWALYGFSLLRWEQFDRQFMSGMVVEP